MGGWGIPPLRAQEGHVHGSRRLQGLPAMKPSIQTQAGALSGLAGLVWVGAGSSGGGMSMLPR